ncbi:response regulator [Temperatibacter marinus]|uniref:Response regulator n=1 Tax=Temperatibacter marinus TaxID=1456591 RepID=A0AA52EGH9_9PROT|nr:response regulator [Temperatibacter marinus]WND01646.1 response regulator [Temperatibacter marinus]
MSTILIVEDNEMNRDMLMRRLKRKGFDVVCSINGQEGVDMALKLIPDCIIMDMNMPVMDGFEATRFLKANEAVSHIPIIALTAYALDEDENKCLAAGCDTYVAKPLDFKELLASMAAFEITA